MPLESTMICLDTSEFMRNGDYSFTRLEAELDAARIVIGAKLRDHPDSTVGILTQGGKGVKVLCSPSKDDMQILSLLHGIQPYGGCTFGHGIKVAMLALRHRLNKHGAQRIIVFVGSPVNDDDRSLKTLADALRKNNIYVDIIAMGENDTNEAKLQTFVDTVNSNDPQSHLVKVPVGTLPSDVLMTSPVIGGGGGGGVTGGIPFGGVDAELDPELAAALRASMEDQRATIVATDAQPNVPGSAPTSGGFDVDMTDDERIMQAILAQSLAESSAAAPTPAPASAPVVPEVPVTPAPTPAVAPGSSEGTAATATPAPTASSSGGDGDASFTDPAFINELLASLGEDIDLNDPLIREAIEGLKKSNEGKPDSDAGKK